VSSAVMAVADHTDAGALPAAPGTPGRDVASWDMTAPW
jgi:hypothetical protein